MFGRVSSPGAPQWAKQEGGLGVAKAWTVPGEGVWPCRHWDQESAGRTPGVWVFSEGAGVQAQRAPCSSYSKVPDRASCFNLGDRRK